MKSLLPFPKIYTFALLAAFLLAGAVQAQETLEIEKDTRPVRNMFESTWMIDNQTVIVPIQGTFQMDILHRFGTLENGYDDFFGLYAPSNIRIGLNYVPINNLQLGFGFTKERMMWDFNAKYSLFQQGREGGWPVSATYFVNLGWDTRDAANFIETTDRFSCFHQLMLARKLTRQFSLQAALSLSHFNFQRQIPTDENPEITQKMNNDHLALALMGRYKVTPTLAVIAGYDLPITEHEVNNPEPNLSFGIEVVSSSHAFQIFVGNYKNIVPQLNNVFNSNSIGDGQFLIGFNMTRLWNF